MGLRVGFHEKHARRVHLRDLLPRGLGRTDADAAGVGVVGRDHPTGGEQGIHLGVALDVVVVHREHDRTIGKNPVVDPPVVELVERDGREGVGREVVEVRGEVVADVAEVGVGVVHDRRHLSGHREAGTEHRRQAHGDRNAMKATVSSHPITLRRRWRPGKAGRATAA